MRIGISGKGGSGKDEAGKILSEVSVLRYKCGTSMWAAERVFFAWGDDHYPDVQSCWEDRRNHREVWAEIIGRYNSADPVAMYRDCLEEQDILTGVRWRHEFEACRAAGLVDLWIWIERDGCEDATMEFTSQDCDLTIENNGTIADLRAKLVRLSAAWGIGLSDHD